MRIGGWIFLAVQKMSAVSEVVIFLVTVSLSIGGPLPPYHLKCQGALVGLNQQRLQQLERQKLVATDNPQPILSWTLDHTERAARQFAFQVIVAEDKNLKVLYWDTGKIVDQDRTSIRYDGPKLRTGKTYFWKVIWWDINDDSATSDETGHFLSGVLDVKDWENAKWIAAGDNIRTAPYIHKTFRLSPLASQNLTVFIAALGFHKLFVNGVDQNSKFDPPVALASAWTNYEKLVPYYAYDVPLPAVIQYNLTLGIMLGRGWRNTDDYPLRDPGGIPKNDSQELVVKVYIIYFDYSRNTSAYLISDNSWSVDETNITSDSIYGGESFGYWEPVKTSSVRVVTGPSGELYTVMIPYIAEVGIDKLVRSYSLPDGNQVADFGNNSAGYCQVYCDDEPDYSIRHAEVPLHPPFGPMNGSLFYDNLKNATATDSYDGFVESTHKPFFTYHGFRYAEVEGFVRMSLTDRNIQKIVIHSNVARNSKFDSSIPLLNNIQENCIRGQLSNLMSVVTDCDQRSERIGWMGDASLSAETMTLNFDMHAFHDNFLNLMKVEIINGTLPDVVPFYRGGRRPADPSWSAAFPEILYRLVSHNNDLTAAEKYYPSLLEYINTTVNAIPEAGITKFPNCRYGDWAPPQPMPKVDSNFTGASSFLINVKQTMEIAKMLGKNEDADMLETMFNNLVNMYNKEFMTSNTQYLVGTQPTYVLPLAVGAVPNAQMTAFVKAFLNSLENPNRDNSHVAGGIVTTRYLFPVLSQLKEHDIALKIALQMDYPSYGLMIHNNLEPATTIWELWNTSTGYSSRNHHMFSSISGWIVTDMTGLSIRNGFKDIHYFPANSLGLSHVSVSLQHPKPVHLSWRRNGGVQCAKEAENQSPLNPNLPKHNDLSLSCGDEDGGIIQKVLFSSYGNPTGHCGGYYKYGSCHASNSLEVAEKLCLGERCCVIPTGADYWGNPCPGEVKWLMVSVQCKLENSEVDDFIFTSIQTNISIPMGSRGLIHLPAYGKHSMKLWEDGRIIFSEGSKIEEVLGIVAAQWESNADSLAIELESGHYSFVWKGDNPHRMCFDSKTSSDNNQLVLQCFNSTDVITTISWASFGNPELSVDHNCWTHSIGECHAGSSKYAIEQECVGKKMCVIEVTEHFFGDSHCLDGGLPGRLVVEYTCNTR